MALAPLGGAMSHNSKSGVAHFASEDEESCLEDARYLMGFLPSNNLELPPRFEPSDDPEREDPELDTVVRPVRNQVVATAPGATENDIPWLRLDVAEHRGHGILSSVTAVQRINTKGGVALGACETAGSSLIVPYSADYVFVRKN